MGTTSFMMLSLIFCIVTVNREKLSLRMRYNFLVRCLIFLKLAVVFLLSKVLPENFRNLISFTHSKFQYPKLRPGKRTKANAESSLINYFLLQII